MLQENKNEMKVKWRKRLIINGHGPCETYTSSGCDIRYSPIQQILFFFRKQLTTGCSFKHKILSKRVTNTKKNYLHQIKPQKPIFFKLNTTVHVKFFNKRNEKKKKSTTTTKPWSQHFGVVDSQQTNLGDNQVLLTCISYQTILHNSFY